MRDGIVECRLMGPGEEETRVYAKREAQLSNRRRSWSLRVVFVRGDGSWAFVDLRRKSVLPETDQLPCQRQALSIK
jgi:hypothetical protein